MDGYGRPATRGWKPGNCPPTKFSKTCLIVRYNIKLKAFWPLKNLQFVAALSFGLSVTGWGAVGSPASKNVGQCHLYCKPAKTGRISPPAYRGTVAQPEWDRRNHAPPDTNLPRFLLVLCIDFQLLERRQWLTTSFTGSSRTKFLAALRPGQKGSRIFYLVDLGCRIRFVLKEAIKNWAVDVLLKFMPN